MSELKRFHKNFRIKFSLEEEKRTFVNRINQVVFYWVRNSSLPIQYDNIFRNVCYALAINTNHMKPRDCLQSLSTLTNDDFLQTLKVIITLYNVVFDRHPEVQKRISDSVTEALSLSTVDLGVKWQDGMFYPSGAKLLDEELVEDPLDWLEDYPTVKGDFLKALKSYSK